MQLARVLGGQLLQGHELGVAHKLRHVRPGARERVQDVHPLVAQALAELAPHRAVGCVQHVVHDLQRRVHDAQLLARARERLREELVVQVLDQRLAVGVRAAEARAAPHARVELVQAALVLVGEVADAVALKGLDELRDRDRDRVRLGEGVVVEQGVEHRQRHHVLRDHLDGRLLAHAGVQRVPKRAQEAVHGLAGHGVLGHRSLDLLDVPLRDAAHVLGPAGPVDLVAALLHGLGVDGALQEGRAELDRHLRAVAAARAGSRRVAAARALVVAPAASLADAQALALPARLSHGQAVDVGVDALVVASKRLQHAPHHVEGVRLVERVHGRHLRRDGHRQDDVAQLLLVRLPLVEGAHDAAHCLHDVDLRALGREEDDGVQRRHVHALGQAARVGEDAALALLALLGEPRQLLGARLRVHGAVDVVQVAGRPALVAGGLHVGLDDLLERLVDLLRALDGRAEAHGAAKRLHPAVGIVQDVGEAVFGPVVEVVHQQEVGRVRRLVALQLVKAPRGVLAVGGKPAPAADDLGLVAYVELGLVAVARHDDLRARHGLLVDGQHDHAVVAQEALLHRLGEGHLVGHRSVLPLVVHRVQLGGRYAGLRHRVLAVDLGRRRHEEPLVGPHALAVHDYLVARHVLVLGKARAGCAVRLVADAKAKARQPRVLRVLDHLHALVGAKDHDHGVGVVLPRPAVVVHQRLRAGRRGEAHVDCAVQQVVLADPRRVRVRAHHQRAEGHARLVGPLAHRLRHERDRGRAEQHVPAARALQALLGKAKGGERLAGAARHDRLGTVVALEARLDLLDGLHLVRARVVRACPALLGRLLVVAHEQRPVDVGLLHG